MTTPTATRDDFLLAHWGKAAWIAEGHELHVPADDLARIVEMCKERALRLSEGSQWIPVTERWPDRSIPVLMRLTPHRNPIDGGSWGTTQVGYRSFDEFEETEDWVIATPLGVTVVTVTHWMPLPEAPK